MVFGTKEPTARSSYLSVGQTREIALTRRRPVDIRKKAIGRCPVDFYRALRKGKRDKKRDDRDEDTTASHVNPVDSVWEAQRRTVRSIYRTLCILV